MVNSMMAASPLTDYAIQVALYTLMTGVLVSVLLIGGFLVLNLGLLSKRNQDRAGGRSPADLNILGHTIWPEQPEDMPTLPAEPEPGFLHGIHVKKGERKPGRAA